MSVGLKGRQTARTITLHTANMARSLASMAEALADQGHVAEAGYLRVAAVGCEAAAFSIAAKTNQ